MKKRIVFLSSLLILISFIALACGVLSVPKATPTPQGPVGPMATAMAMAQQVTLVPPTPMGGISSKDIAPDDYVGIFKQAWTIVKTQYVRDNYNGADWDAIYDQYLPRAEQVTSSDELHALLTDLIAELKDDHSRYVPPRNMEAEFGVGKGSEALPWTGIDVWPSRDDEAMFAWYVCANGPAASAGIVRGDVILAVNGQSLERGDDGFTREQRRAVIFGTGGNSVTLTIQSGPDEAPRDVTLSLGGANDCDDWQYKIVSTSPRIGYIRIPNFEGDAATRIMEYIRAMEKDTPMDGLILDVRHNPGGNSDDSAAIFAKGIVGTVGPLRSDATRTVYRIRGVDWNDTTPLAVLTDANSHSAADYFPAALKELERATIIGTNSAGNTEGIVSFNLADGTLIRLAVSALLLNDGSSLEGVGVEPDLYVPLGMWGLHQQPYDVQLQAAIDFLSGT